MLKTLILIPSRLSANRLPNKPLLKINGLSMINHVYRKAKRSRIGEVYVATGDIEIYKDVINNGGKCILTKKKHNSGTDRIYEAFNILNANTKFDYILNVQGDEPMINSQDLYNLNNKIVSKGLNMGTLASLKINKKNLKNKNIVKVQTEKKLNHNNISKALKFFRYEKKDYLNTYHHIGVYIYKKKIIKKIVSLKQSKNEIKFNLEQLRAMDNKIVINVVLAKTIPISVDTIEDYKKIKKIFKKNYY
tara:strand:- start:809 stop:1552 length:744 start_codon:yes stop_codon:yes gene_type:complete